MTTPAAGDGATMGEANTIERPICAVGHWSDGGRCLSYWGGGGGRRLHWQPESQNTYAVAYGSDEGEPGRKRGETALGAR